MTVAILWAAAMEDLGFCMASIDHFNDHCWKDVVPETDRELDRHWRGDTSVGPRPASAFQGTPLFSHLSLLGVQSLIVCGESTSGCVRASVVDAHSNGFHVSIVEQCTFDRAELTHKVNLFDLHHKYADVMHLDEVVAHLDAMRMDRAAE
jgi:nicotinamidase-related amidase